jgi:hypothetical protein
VYLLLTDLVVGLGEIGYPLYKLLKERNFRVDGYDPKKKGFERNQILDHYDMIHLCIPYSDEFIDIAKNYKKLCDHLVIHSTVKDGTSKKVGAIYSPVRGTHNDMFENLKYFTKFYSDKKENLSFQRRFPNCIRVDDSAKLEVTKMVQTSKLGFYIALDRYFQEHHPHYREFSFELHQKYGNQPSFYNDGKPIGGHCIIPNADMLGDTFVADFVKKYGGIN